MSVRRILMDANIGLRFVHAANPEHRVVRGAVERLVDAGHVLAVTPQVLREMWVVLTRPEEVNGFGRTPDEAASAIRLLLEEFTLLEDEPGIFAEWLRLVAAHGVVGAKGHDANHVAAARHHGITHVLTLNERDFRRYAHSGLSVLTPQDI